MKTTLNSHLRVSLTLGSTHVSLVAAAQLQTKQASQPEKAVLPETGSAPREGHFPVAQEKMLVLGASRVVHNGAIKKGVISSIDAAANAILDALDEVERQSGLEISAVRVCIAGTVAQFDNHTEILQIKGDEIRDSDVTKVCLAARNQKPFVGFDCIHMIPSLFSVDNKQGILNPVGMRGASLSVLYHRIFYPQADLHNIVKACNNAGLRVQGFVFEPLAAAEGVLTADEKEFGCLSLSMGAQLTHVAVFMNGVPVFSHEYPVGSHHITKDLSIGLRTTQAEAERIKKEFGYFSESHLKLKEINEKIEIGSIDGNTSRVVTRQEIHSIMEPRVHEIMRMVYQDLRKRNLLSHLVKGVILSGGGVLLSGATLDAEKIFGVQARVGTPANISGMVEGLRSPLWASTLGALSPLFSGELEEPVDAPTESDSGFGSFATKIWSRLKEPFSSR